ncbi:DUF1232 domain-containing protein [Fulvivirga sp. RKSG066]|uniref:YkvA family protein n=1 Tax=Fulvivirga aurantia TaxID=2529383 RepID=UPI0012BBE8F9|nr:YkvA family protein [Fulvivirga aurantia]MTI21092.1 DUF1232 domain-containing protein [Fulvivirga aurantia]
MESARENKFFKNAKQRASRILKNKEQLQYLLKAAGDKLKDVNVQNIKNSSLAERIRVIRRMIIAYAKGEYRQIKATNVLLLVAAVVYFVTPVDLVPDFIPITGFIDDFSIVVWVYSKLQQEIDEYILWENSKEVT